MGTTITMLKTIAIFIALAMPGLILVKTKMVKAEQTIILSKILLYVGLPFLVFTTTAKLELNSSTIWAIVITAIISVVYTFLGFVLSKYLVKKVDGVDRKKMARFCMIAGNTGFLGIPLAQAVFTDNPLVVTCVIVVNVFSVAVIYTMGAYILCEDKKMISAKGIITNPIIIAFLLGLIANITKVYSIVPEVETYANYLTNIVTPLSMTVLGVKLGDTNFKKIFTNKLTYKVSFYRLIAYPVIITAILLIINIFVPVQQELIYGIFIGNAMPVAASASTYADNFNCDIEGCVLHTLGTTILSIFTISILYFLLVLVI